MRARPAAWRRSTDIPSRHSRLLIAQELAHRPAAPPTCGGVCVGTSTPPCPAFARHGACFLPGRATLPGSSLMKAVRGTSPTGGIEGKKLGRCSPGNQGLEELADWLPQLYTRISSRCLGGALAPQRQYRGEETRPALVRSTDLIRKELRWADKQPHSVQWGASRSRCTSFAEATQPVY